MTNKEELAYIAGFFDGEGTVAIKKQQVTMKGKRYYSYIPRVSIANCYFPIIFRIKELFGGCVYVTERSDSNHVNIATWEVNCKKAVGFLQAIFPYLRQKKDEAQVAMDFYKTKNIKDKEDRKHAQKDQFNLMRSTRVNNISRSQDTFQLN